jgi:hypothetical protein
MTASLPRPFGSIIVWRNSDISAITVASVSSTGVVAHLDPGENQDVLFTGSLLI